MPTTTSQPADQPSIAIVGASITGPVLALLLHRAGFHQVRLYEASPAPTQQAGGIIGLDHPSLTTLADLGISQQEIIPFTSERVVTITVQDQREASRTEHLYPGRNTAWHLLNHTLLQRLPQHWLHLGQRVRAISPTEHGPAVLEFLDAEPSHADLVIFTDGRRSTGRRLLAPKRTLTYAGYIAWRGQGPYQPHIEHFTRIDPVGAAFNLSPLRQTSGHPATDWTLYLDMPEPDFHTLLGADPTVRTYLLPHQFTGQVRALVQGQANRLLKPAAAHLIAATPTWTAAPIVDLAPSTQAVYPIGAAHAILLGDALAPVRPHTASGANLGIAQAAGLAGVLSQHLHHGADLVAALHGWQQRHLPAVRAAQQLGPELGASLGLGTARGRILVTEQ
ncbi:monooxygenase [Nonomuraea soli]|uniref:2,6-dihydroxypyridine 3-monooxygenase n=1 Tax=Nonomuraea soli TaxID=1032476 RepID=A0A7W0CUU1_9ACTN|nr:monooxygenase [Nonomuraea soli]MBA2897754.1 2,6-dihydroxypyridine 3-monooxygenase [Nonomuraea soli]